MPRKIERLEDHHWVPHHYADTFAYEATTGALRLRIGARDGHADLMLALAQVLRGPFYLLYVLHTPRIVQPGRYQSPLVQRAELQGFVQRFAVFLSADGRHDFWIYAPTNQATLVWDRHDLVYAYGPLERYEDVLVGRGLGSGLPEIPVPHAHHYREEHDSDELAVMEQFAWSRTPLQADDVQYPFQADGTA